MYIQCSRNLYLLTVNYTHNIKNICGNVVICLFLFIQEIRYLGKSVNVWKMYDAKHMNVQECFRNTNVNVISKQTTNNLVII